MVLLVLFSCWIIGILARPLHEESGIGLQASSTWYHNSDLGQSGDYLVSSFRTDIFEPIVGKMLGQLSRLGIKVRTSEVVEVVALTVIALCFGLVCVIMTAGYKHIRNVIDRIRRGLEARDSNQ